MGSSFSPFHTIDGLDCSLGEESLNLYSSTSQRCRFR